MVDKVRSISGAKTAIGASLAVADQDLAAGQGQKLILLITDGEETCGGKPKDEIERLRLRDIGGFASVLRLLHVVPCTGQRDFHHLSHGDRVINRQNPSHRDTPQVSILSRPAIEGFPRGPQSPGG